MDEKRSNIPIIKTLFNTISFECASDLRRPEHKAELI